MGKGYGRSNYGEADEKLRRQLGLEGELPQIESRFDVQPTIVVADGLQPGSTARKNWRFMVGLPPATNPGTGTTFFRAVEPVIIERIQISTSANIQMSIHQVNLGGLGGGNPGGSFFDRNFNNTLIPPIRTGTLAAPVGNLVVVYQQIAVAAPFYLDFPSGMMLFGDGTDGMGLSFTALTAATISGLVIGRLA